MGHLTSGYDLDPDRSKISAHVAINGSLFPITNSVYTLSPQPIP